jgi:CO dehydrogenase maturation factor
VTPVRRVRVAFVGKGGSGKSTISGTFARLLARRGEPVLALDSDPMPGMAYALGAPVDDGPIPDDAVVQGPEGGPRWVLHPTLDAAMVIDRYAAVCPDHVRYLQFGNLWGHISALQKAQHAWSQVVRELDGNRWHLVGDLPGGTRQAMFGWGKYAQVVCVVVEPTAKSLHSAQRLLNLDRATWAPQHVLVVANKVDDPLETERIASRLDRPVVVSVPRDPVVLAGDRRAIAPLEASPHGEFVTAVQALVDAVIGLEYGAVPGGST